MKIEATESPRYLETRMTANPVDTRTALRQALEAVSPPEKITQEAFEHDDTHLRRLLRLQSGQRPEAGDLFAYMEDLLYTKIQSSLLAYLLPVCLEVWCDDLRGIGIGYGGVMEHFYAVLADRRVLESHLTPKQTAAISDFMRQAILEEIDNQRGLAYQGSKARPCRWIGALTTYGVIFPDLERVWTAWWSLDTVGRAISAIQYISCLMYPENENPVFSPWTPDAGGGPPCLWEFEGHLYTHRWLEPNVSFLRKALNVRTVEKLLSRAIERLIDQPEHEAAAKVQADFPLCLATLEVRCAELPRLLGTRQEPGRLDEWSTKP